MNAFSVLLAEGGRSAARIALAGLLIAMPGWTGILAQTPSQPWICEDNRGDTDTNRSFILQNDFQQRLEQFAIGAESEARRAYEEATAIVVPLQPNRGPNLHYICSQLPGGDCPTRRARYDICELAPAACPRKGREILDVSFEEALEIARELARTRIDNSTPLPDRATLVGQVSTNIRLSGLPGSLRRPMAEYAIALELLEEGRRAADAFDHNLLHRDCAHQIRVHYDVVAATMPPVSTLLSGIAAAVSGLSNFGLPGEQVAISLPVDPVATANFLDGFATHVHGADDHAGALFEMANAFHNAHLDSDASVRITNSEVPPIPGYHFRIMWLGSDLYPHWLNARTAHREISFNRSAFDHGIALLQSGLSQFAPGGGGDPSVIEDIVFNALGIVGNITVDTFCEGSGGTQPVFVGLLDASGDPRPFLNTQSGLLRGDAKLIVESIVLCAARWTLKDALDLQGAILAGRTELERETSPAARHKALMQSKEAAYDAVARAASARAAEIEALLP